MDNTSSAKPLLCPVTHLDDLGQRSKHALIGHELCLGTLQLHGNGGRGGTTLGRARSDNRRDVERLGNVALKERAYSHIRTRCPTTACASRNGRPRLAR